MRIGYYYSIKKLVFFAGQQKSGLREGLLYEIDIQARKDFPKMRPSSSRASQLIATSVLLLIVSISEATTPLKTADAGRPNILLIVADDLGFSDLGSFGSEIDTPHLDQMANVGLRLNNFHAGASCSPSRSMLLSGTDNHIAGLGAMAEGIAPNQLGHPGYEGYLNFDVVSAASLLQDAGYQTYMAGKWHLGKTPELGPRSRGFKRSFALTSGGAGHFDDLPTFGPKRAEFMEDGKFVKLPDDFYSSKFYVDKIISYLKDDQPFFAYLAYTALHWPLQAPKQYLQKYKGKYAGGWDDLRKDRFMKAKAHGLIAKKAVYPKRHPKVPAWSSLTPEQQKIEARKMEIYSAMLDNLGVNVGKLVSYLKQSDQFDNTFILVMSDNGAEGVDLGGPVFSPWIEKSDNSFENMGKENSFMFTGPQWEQASTAPFDYFKSFTSEGGLRVPAMVHYPSVAQASTTSSSFASVMDVAPTVRALAQQSHPGDDIIDYN